MRYARKESSLSLNCVASFIFLRSLQLRGRLTDYKGTLFLLALANPFEDHGEWVMGNEDIIQEVSTSYLGFVYFDEIIKLFLKIWMLSFDLLIIRKILIILCKPQVCSSGDMVTNLKASIRELSGKVREQVLFVSLFLLVFLILVFLIW